MNFRCHPDIAHDDCVCWGLQVLGVTLKTGEGCKWDDHGECNTAEAPPANTLDQVVTHDVASVFLLQAKVVSFSNCPNDKI